MDAVEIDPWKGFSRSSPDDKIKSLECVLPPSGRPDNQPRGGAQALRQTGPAAYRLFRLKTVGVSPMPTKTSHFVPGVPQSRSLLARKGAATSSGFAGAPELVSPTAAQPDVRAAPLVMIVEDNALNMKMMIDLLEGHGFCTLPAVNGPQALATARAERPDLIVMDIELPGLSGLEVMRQLKANADLKNIPVIVVSAMARAEDEAVARHAGCDDYLAKPVSTTDMLSMVDRFVR
jgi:two-component system cell cycle response regulator DivK